MRASMLWFALLPCLGLQAAQAADALKSAACAQALDALQDVEDALALAAAGDSRGSTGQRQAVEQLKVLKQRAAGACLGSGAEDLAPAQRAPGAPAGRVSIPGAALTAAAAAPAASRAARISASPTPSPLPLLSLVSCDAAGCWASDGTRLQRSGPLLLGPRGFCNVAGSVLSCP